MAERQKICTKVYLDSQGNEARSAYAAAKALRFKFANDEVREVSLDNISEDVGTCAAWHGLSQTLGDTYAGAKGDVDVAIEAFDTKLEVLLGGVWVEKREGVGPRPSLVADAVKAALEANDETVDEDRYKAIREKLASAEARKQTLANPIINAQYEALRLAKQQAKAKEAKAAAKASGASLEGF